MGRNIFSNPTCPSSSSIFFSFIVSRTRLIFSPNSVFLLAMSLHLNNDIFSHKIKFLNYDFTSGASGGFKQRVPFMPDSTFRMLLCGPSGSGKTNVLLNMIMDLLFFDKIFLYRKNLEQPKIQFLIKAMKDISKEAGYPIIECSNDKIIPVFRNERRQPKTGHL